jgi:transposase-like protein
VTVGRYLRYGLSYRDVEELLAERGIEVDHVTVYRWGPRCATRGHRTDHPELAR